MSVTIDGAGSLIGVDQGLNIVGLTTLTGGIILDDSISHIGDTNTKIRFPAADTFTVETAGSERLRITSDGKVRVPDSGIFVAGSDNDLQIYHNGSDSFITDNRRHLIVRADGSGDLYLQSDNKVILSDIGGNETFIECNDDGNVSLYYDNSKKLETTSVGLTIHEDTDKTISFTGGIGEIGNVTGFQALNTAGSALVDFGMRANTLRFATGSAERLRIDSSGRVLQGLTSAKFGFFNDNNAPPVFQIQGDTYYDSALSIFRDGTGASGPNFILAKGRGAIVQDNDILGTISFQGHDGTTELIEGASIVTEVDGTPSANNVPSALVFKTNSGTSITSEKLRITSNGRVHVTAGDFKVTDGNSGFLFQESNNGAFLWLDGADGDFTGGDYYGIGANNSAQLQFGYAGSAHVVLNSSGDLSMGTTNAAAKLDVRVASNNPTTGSPASGSFLQVRSDTTTVGNGPSLALMNLSGSKETGWRLSALTTSGNNGDFAIHGYSGGATYTERFRILNDGQFEMNGVRNIYQSFSLVNNQNYNWDFTVPDEGNYGNSFYLVAGYNHYYTTNYGAHRTVWFSARGTSVNSMGNGIEQYHSQSGGWTFSKPNATTVRITKTSGSYGGSGYGFFHLMYNHF